MVTRLRISTPSSWASMLGDKGAHEGALAVVVQVKVVRGLPSGLFQRVAIPEREVSEDMLVVLIAADRSATDELLDDVPLATHNRSNPQIESLGRVPKDVDI